MKYIVNSLLYRNRYYRFLYIGQFVSFIGTTLTSIVFPYQIYQQTNSILLVGLLGFCQLMPLLFTALMGGIMADRYYRRLLLLGTECLLALSCLVLAWNASLPTPSIAMVFVMASCMSAITGFHRPALDSMTQELVSRNDFPVVGALSSFKFSCGMIVGPAIGGLILAHFGVSVTFLIDFVTFAISLGTLLLIPETKKQLSKKHSSAWTSLKEGFSYAFSRQELMGSYVVDFVAMVFGMPNALFPAIAQQYGGAKVLGVLYAAPAVGALLVSLWGGWAHHIKRHGAAIAITAGLWGVAIIFFGLASHLLVALIFLALAGAFDALSGVFRSTLWNQTVANSFRGRLAGIEMISYLSGPRLGDAEAGLVAALCGVTTSIVSGGILCVIAVIICSYSLPKFWHYRLKE